MKEDSAKAEIRKGLLTLAVLQAVKVKKRYAAEILSSLSATEFATQEGTLYPLLSRLKREGLIDHEWVESASGPPRKYYLLSDSGNKRLAELLKYIDEIRKQVKQLGGDR